MDDEEFKEYISKLLSHSQIRFFNETGEIVLGPETFPMVFWIMFVFLVWGLALSMMLVHAISWTCQFLVLSSFPLWMLFNCSFVYKLTKESLVIENVIFKKARRSFPWKYIFEFKYAPSLSPLMSWRIKFDYDDPKQRRCVAYTNTTNLYNSDLIELLNRWRRKVLYS